MNFLADESCAGPRHPSCAKQVMTLLRLPKSRKGATDEQVLARAVNEKRVLITEDRDFGELLYARGRSSAGVILVRFLSSARRAKPATVVEAVAKLGLRLRNAFTIVGPGRVRISDRP